MGHSVGWMGGRQSLCPIANQDGTTYLWQGDGRTQSLGAHTHSRSPLQHPTPELLVVCLLVGEVPSDGLQFLHCDPAHFLQVENECGNQGESRCMPRQE